MSRHYYSVRTGKNPNGSNITLPVLASLFYTAYKQLDEAGFFQEHFGYWCVDSGEVAGKLGSDVAATLLLYLRKEVEWPFPEKFIGLGEDDLFDIIEFLHDHVSKPTDGYYHSFSQCGWHYHTFDGKAGRTEYRDRVNFLLESYKGGYELSETGEILEIPQPGTGPLLAANLPCTDEKVTERVASAIMKFRRYRSTLAERRDAIRDLADVLEYLRPRLKEVLTRQDEADLFNIANNFGIRHHNQQQKSDYDASIWLSWMFYYYLATIHAALRMVEKKTGEV
ncbi:MAG: hypothetical protein P9F75_11655 [Candidatus Contendobacter sp.]|nr:hypothetical protein [Candidatus Contendobacter sp.]